MKPFFSGHEDLVHDIAYDFYGKRLATCSSDQHVKVFDKTENGSWELCDSWKAHDSAVVKISWASPEYGQVIATCSYDSTIRIFEEDSREAPRSGKRWKRKHTISDFGGPLYDIEFAPGHLGLKIASIGSDGTFRIHEALDPNSMHYWSTVVEVSILSNPPSRTLQSSFALSWCPSMFFKEFIVIGVLEDAFIYQKDSQGRFVRAAQLPEHKGLIRDVAWAPSMGRGYQLVATASKDGYVRIFKITQKQSRDFGDEDHEKVVPLDVELISKHDDHHGEVWRVSWNLTGTILASSGDDGKVRFWKGSYSSEFQCMAVVSAEERGDDVIDEDNE
ncbi:nucleoporin Seh1p [Trichomonascus vanleenenianus]|uniref:Seh1p n=1 Tax=Trichomonascus vanleenenianus TaxID=2268995 RepID=UPI003ECA1C0C